MRKALLFLPGMVALMSLMASAPAIAQAQEAIAQLDLGGQWEFTVLGVEGAPWMPATVPGCVHTDLMANQQLADPFLGQNELDAQWIEDYDWLYLKTFTADAALLGRRRVELVCEGLDTIAALRLNGKSIGSADNMFRRWTFPLDGALIEGKNTLEIAFMSPMRYVAQLRQRLLVPMPATNDPIGGSPFVRKAPYHFGWDWGPRLTTSGVWKPIRIVAYDDQRIEYVTTRQRHDAKGVDLDVTVELRAPVAGRTMLTAAIAGAVAHKEVEAPEGLSRHTLTCRVDNPKLWWPAGHGEQALYDLVVVAQSASGHRETVKKRIGFRTVELQALEDARGVSFTIVVNGQPIYCKGANWIPCDSFIPRVDEARYRRWLTDARDCNMNMIRVWGGGIYENDVFYDLCDELGLMVWQDFMFSCSLYPVYKDFLESVAAEARHNVKRLMDHPALMLYCGNNECETAVRQWYKLESTEWQSYVKLFHELLPDLCAELDPDRPYWPSSPHSVASRNPATEKDGDAHVWQVWHGAMPFEEYEKIDARFVSEFGFQSFPPLATIREYADNAALNLTAPDIEHHQKNVGGNTRILTQMADRFRMPTNFANFVVLSQLQQGLAMQMAVDHWRRRMPFCMGTLYWQLDDCWPVASWSSIDYHGRWKALQYMARHFYAPWRVSATGKRGAGEGAAAASSAASGAASTAKAVAKAASIDAAATDVTLWFTSDIARQTTATFNWRLQTYAGDVIASDTLDVLTTGPISASWATIKAGQHFSTYYTERNCYLTFRVTDGELESRNVHHFAPFKSLALPRPALTVTTRPAPDGVAVTVATDVFAKWVWLEPAPAANAPTGPPATTQAPAGRFNDNYFDLDPGESRTVIYKGAAPERFVAKSLVDTYAE